MSVGKTNACSNPRHDSSGVSAIWHLILVAQGSLAPAENAR